LGVKTGPIADANVGRSIRRMQAASQNALKISVKSTGKAFSVPTQKDLG